MFKKVKMLKTQTLLWKVVNVAMIPFQLFLEDEADFPGRRHIGHSMRRAACWKSSWRMEGN